MPSGAGVVNPGLSTWIFIAAVRLFSIQAPPDLARVVQCGSVIALCLGMIIGFRMIGRAERRAWIWGIALGCVNPFAVLFGRKIWAQSILPLFCVFSIAGWLRRGTRWGAFAWGLGGAWLGQIHMSGFFLAAALLIWTALYDRMATSETERRKICWPWWVFGSLTGVLSLLPWIWHLLTHGSSARDHQFLAVLVGHNVLGLWYWILWVTGALGLGMSYSLGVDEFISFWRYPLLLGRPTFAVAVAHLVLLGLGGWLLLSRVLSLRLRAVDWKRAILGCSEPADRLLKSALYGSGLLLTLIGYPLYRHYLIVTFPLEWFWLARQMRIATRHWTYLLGAIWVSELIISAAFLYYIHANHGAPTGDYGATYMHSH
jgi:hypothetical protein